MKNRIYHIFGAAALLCAAAALLLFPDISKKAAADGLAICGTALIPALFPFFVLTNLWNSHGYATLLSRTAAPVMERIFHLPGAVAAALTAGCVGGYPVGAQTIAALYISRTISRRDAEQALLFCSNAGPAFLFGVIGNGIFHSPAIGAILYLLHIGTALLIGFLFRPRCVTAQPISHSSVQKTLPFLPSLTDAIVQAGTTTIRICFFVIFFSVLTVFLDFFMPEALHASPWFTMTLGGIELAGGAKRLAAVTWSARAQLAAAAFLVGWGGFCVHCQTISILRETHLSSRRYFLGKLLQGLLSGGLAWFLAPLLPLPVSCTTIAPLRLTPLWQLALLFVFSTVILLFLKITSGKMTDHRI